MIAEWLLLCARAAACSVYFQLESLERLVESTPTLFIGRACILLTAATFVVANVCLVLAVATDRGWYLGVYLLYLSAGWCVLLATFNTVTCSLVSREHLALLYCVAITCACMVADIEELLNKSLDRNMRLQEYATERLCALLTVLIVAVVCCLVQRGQQH